MQTHRLMPMTSSAQRKVRCMLRLVVILQSIYPCPTRVYVKHHGSRLLLLHSSLSDTACFRKTNLEEIKSSSYLSSQIDNNKNQASKLLPNGDQEPTAISAKVDTTCEEQGRHRLRNPEQERQADYLCRETLATKTSEEYISTSNPEQERQGVGQLRRLVGSWNCTNLARGRDGCELRGCEEQIDGREAGEVW